MTDIVKAAAVKLRAEQIERRDEIDACLTALRQGLSGSKILQEFAVAVRIQKESDRTLLVVRRGEEEDSDFEELVVGVDYDGWLIGPWGGHAGDPDRRVYIDTEAARELMDGFVSTVVNAFKVSV